ncbi:MAG: T9SS type A sorting domain-containing protein [Candidatus Sabulitectum sp.]|nr:T9SS type A sorting domain-containing protein [Candidatus Sabulitectum sp.]
MRSFVLSISLLVLFFSQSVFAQPPATEWTQAIGGPSAEAAYSVIQTSNGDFVVVGITDSYGSGNGDIYMVKTDSSGDTIWWRAFGGTEVDQGYSVQETSDGGFIIAGSSKSFGAGDYEAYLVKTSSSGNVEWSKVYGGTYPEHGNSVLQTSDGGYIVAGSTSSFGAGGIDVYLVKTDASGIVMWAKAFGGTGDEEAQSIQQTDDGGYIIAGRTTSSGAGSSDVYLIKTDSDGNSLWTRTFGGSSYDNANSVEQTSDGGYIITGRYESANSVIKLYLIKTDSYGDAVWSKTIECNDYAVGESVGETTDGGFIIAGFTVFGTTNIDALLIKTDVNGDTLWTAAYGGTGSEAGYSVQQTNDEGYIIAGMTNSPGADSIDVYLIKLETDTGIEEAHGVNPMLALETAGPNPFSSSLTITYSIPEQSRVELAVFDLTGRLVEELVNDQRSGGTHSVVWSPTVETPNGYYLIRLDACGFSKAVRCLRLN